MTLTKAKVNPVAEIIEAHAKDKELIIKTGKIIDVIRLRFGKHYKGFDSTAILRKIREGHIK